MKGIKSLTNKIMPHTRWVMPAVEKFAKTTIGKIVIAAVIIYFTWGTASGAFAAAGSAADAVVPAVAEGAGWSAAGGASLGAGAGAAGGGAVDLAAGAAAAGTGEALASDVATAPIDTTAAPAVDATGNTAITATGDAGASAGTSGQGIINAAQAPSLGDAAVNSATNVAPDVGQAATNAAQPAADVAANTAADTTTQSTGLVNGAMTPDAAVAPTAPTAAAPDASVADSLQVSGGGDLGAGTTASSSPQGWLSRASQWYGSLSKPAQVAIAQSLAGAGSAGVSAISQREQMKTMLDEQRRREERAKVPDMSPMFSKYNGGIIGSRVKGGG